MVSIEASPVVQRRPPAEVTINSYVLCCFSAVAMASETPLGVTESNGARVLLWSDDIATAAE